MSFVFPSLVAWTPVFLPAALGLAATFLAEGYSIRVWQTEDGLPQNLVSSAVQTRDGYLWLGTFSGLARFDGERIQVFDTAARPPPPSLPARAPACRVRRSHHPIRSMKSPFLSAPLGLSAAEHRRGNPEGEVTLNPGWRVALPGKML